MSQQPLAQPLRSILGLINLAVKSGRMPTWDSLLAKPHDERLRSTIPGFLFKKPPTSVRGEDVYVEGRGGKIHTRVYTRPDTKPGAPGYLFIHGGGFVDGGVEHCDHVCRELADRTGWVVVGLSYRLAPEHPFPAGLDDCVDVFTWMAKETPAGLDPERLAVGGESAGGNLTAALTLWCRDNNGPSVRHQSVIYPFADTSLSLIDWSNNKGNPGVDPAAGAKMVEVYAAPDNVDNPLVNIVKADHRGLPPTLVLTCGHDLLGNEGIAYAKAVAAAGVETVHTHLADMPHGYLLMTRVTKRAYESMDQIKAEADQRF